MTINIANHGGPIVWEGVYYFSPASYPQISDWELRNILMFCAYEKKHGRKTEIICEDADVLAAVDYALANPSLYMKTPAPDLIPTPACINCKQGGCRTDFLCHTTELKFVESIFKSGKLLSAVNARNKTGEELSQEARNGSKDTPDYFDYVMFAWGNCFAGDSLVMERMLGWDKIEYASSEGLQPGARF